MAERVLTEQAIAWAFQKWCEGYSTYQLAKVLYVSQPTIFRAFQNRGLKRHRQPLQVPNFNTQEE